MAKKSNNGGYDAKVWKAIRNEWIAGQMSVSDIGRSYGPTRQAISKRAKDKHWPARGSLVEEVRKEVQAQLLVDDKVAATVAPSEASEIVETAARRGVEVIRHHRVLISRLLGIADATLSDLEQLELITRELLAKKKTKYRHLVIETATKARVDGMRAVSQVLTQAIPLERQAFSLDKDEAGMKPIRYVAPDYDKPAGSGLAEEDWEDGE